MTKIPIDMQRVHIDWNVYEAVTTASIYLLLLS